MKKIELLIDDKIRSYAGIYASMTADKYQRRRAYAAIAALYAYAEYLKNNTSSNVQNSMTIYRNSVLSSKYETADFYINNYHVDVRITIDENSVLIPRIHYDNGIVPDFYAVIKVDKDLRKAEPAGIIDTSKFSPKPFDYNYYQADSSCFISTEEFLERTSIEKVSDFDQRDHDKFKSNYLGFIDGEVSDYVFIEILQHLFKCSECRTEFCCFTGFEMVNKHAAEYPDIIEDKTLDIIGAQKAFDSEDDRFEHSVPAPDSKKSDKLLEKESAPKEETSSLFSGAMPEPLDIDDTKEADLVLIDDDNIIDSEEKLTESKPIDLSDSSGSNSNILDELFNHENDLMFSMNEIEKEKETEASIGAGFETGGESAAESEENTLQEIKEADFVVEETETQSSAGETDIMDQMFVDGAFEEENLEHEEVSYTNMLDSSASLYNNNIVSAADEAADSRKAETEKEPEKAEETAQEEKSEKLETSAENKTALNSDADSAIDTDSSSDNKDDLKDNKEQTAADSSESSENIENTAIEPNISVLETNTPASDETKTADIKSDEEYSGAPGTDNLLNVLSSSETDFDEDDDEEDEDEEDGGEDIQNTQNLELISGETEDNDEDDKNSMDGDEDDEYGEDDEDSGSSEEEYDEDEDDAGDDEMNAENSKSTSLKKILIMLCIAAVLLLAFGAGAYFYLKNKEMFSENTAVQTAEETGDTEVEAEIVSETEKTAEASDSSESAPAADFKDINPALAVSDGQAGLQPKIKKFYSSAALAAVPAPLKAAKAAQPAVIINTENDMTKAITDALSKQHRPLASLREVNWFCDSSLAGDAAFKKYMQNLDNTLKQNLKNNIMGLTETPPQNQVTAKFAVDNNRSLRRVLITESSGSEETDNIVLQSINETFEGEKSPILADSPLKADMYYFKIVIKI